MQSYEMGKFETIKGVVIRDVNLLN